MSAAPGTESSCCRATRCAVPVAAEAFMCPDHWPLVPAPMRTILAQGCGPGSPRSAEWNAIAQAAIAEVAHRQSRKTAGRAATVRRRPAPKAVQLALFDLPAS